MRLGLGAAASRKGARRQSSSHRGSAAITRMSAKQPSAYHYLCKKVLRRCFFKRDEIGIFASQLVSSLLALRLR